MNPALALQHQAATDECPWCGSTISRARFLEIQRRIADEERRKLSIERARMQEQLNGELHKAETRFKLDAEKKVAALAAERDQAAAALKAQAVRAEAARKTAERQLEERLKADFQKKLETVAAERDEAAAKVKKLDSAKQKELQQQRESLEKDRDSKLLKAQVQHNRDREQLLQKIDGLTRQLQRKTSNELGDRCRS